MLVRLRTSPVQLVNLCKYNILCIVVTVTSMAAIGSRGWIDMTRCYRCRDWAEWTCPFSLHATSKLCLVIGNQSSVVQVHSEGLRWLADGDRCFRAILNIVQLCSVREFDTTCSWVKSNVCSFRVVTNLFASANCDGVWWFWTKSLTMDWV